MAKKKQEYIQIGNNNRGKSVSKVHPTGSNCGKSRAKCEIWPKVLRSDWVQMGVADGSRENDPLEEVGSWPPWLLTISRETHRVYLHHYCPAGRWYLCFPFPKADGLLLDVSVSAGAWQSHCCSAGHSQGNDIHPQPWELIPWL